MKKRGKFATMFFEKYWNDMRNVVIMYFPKIAHDEDKIGNMIRLFSKAIPMEV